MTGGAFKEIPLTQGRVALVDAVDHAWLSRYSWWLHRSNTGVYARARVGGRRQRMHRVIIGAGPEQIIDHINGDTLDNRRANLRFCTQAQNQANRVLDRDNTSGFKGVTWHRQHGNWIAHIGFPSVFLGCFPDVESAACCYDNAARQIYGEFARLNFPGLGERGCRPHSEAA